MYTIQVKAAASTYFNLAHEHVFFLLAKIEGGAAEHWVTVSGDEEFKLIV